LRAADDEDTAASAPAVLVIDDEDTAASAPAVLVIDDEDEDEASPAVCAPSLTLDALPQASRVTKRTLLDPRMRVVSMVGVLRLFFF
jgi:hypothetical protein